MRAGTPCRLLAATAGAAMLLSFASSAEAAHRRHRHRQVEPPIAAEPIVAPPPLQDRAAYQSGFAFGLFNLGISGTPSALSPYAGYGTVRPGYDGPGFGYPGY